MQIDKHVVDEKCQQVMVAYLCDRQACETCSYPDCKHTTDIDHAVNFVCVDKKNAKWMERGW